MYRSSTKLVGLGLMLLACGSPGDLDPTRFPPPGQTGYADDPAGMGGAGGVSGGSGGAGLSPGGSGASGNGTTGGSAGSGGAGSGAAGSGGLSTGGTASGSAGAGAVGQGGSGTSPAGGCPDNISELLNRPGAQGGCEGSGCHVSGGQRPDLTSPGVEARLLNVMSTCQGRPYISATDSFLEEKLVESSPDCGGQQMPFFMANALNAEDKQCILDWIDEVAAGM
jgi:hypothetical protein